MSRPYLTGLALVLASAPAFAQDPTPAADTSLAGRCVSPDSVVVRGNSRVSEETIRGTAALAPGQPLNVSAFRRAIAALYATGEFEDVQINCAVTPGGRARLAIAVRERPVVAAVTVRGTDRVSGRTVRDRIDIPVGRALDAAAVARAIGRIDSLYQSRGYYLARVRPDTAITGGRARLTFTIDEGRRLAISGVRVNGNRSLDDKAVVGAMKSKPEGFLWWRKGEFDEDAYAADLADRIPQLYASRGFIDFQVVKDTLIVDRARGKALIDLTVSEGPQYRVGTFDVAGNARFSTEDLSQLYPFGEVTPSVTDRVRGLVRRRRGPSGTFDRSRWETATDQVREQYSNQGYIYAQVRPVITRRVASRDSVPVVDLRWEVDEGKPAIVNRVEIVGNDYTTESCIRSQILMPPGDVFNRDRLIRSYQNISNLNFFETPLAPPDTRPANDSGDVDVVFRVKEKRTGNVNFGASYAATGVGGFIGLQQPNLFGECKQGNLNWTFGGFINDFSLGYTDPAIRQSQLSGTVSAYRSRSRFLISDLGQTVRTGGSVRVGFPVPNSPFTRFGVSYSGEFTDFGNFDETAEIRSLYGNNPFRSTVGLDLTHDTRIDLPFATAGGQQAVTAQFNGGPLGGDASFQRYTAELRSYAPLGQFGGGKVGSQPIKFVLGLTGRAGALFGDPQGFYQFQSFTLGGVQFGEQLRGYPETCVTPLGVQPTDDNSSCRSTRASFGNSFVTVTGEVGMRVSQSLYVNAFYDAGSVFARVSDFNPTRLVRGAGVGASVITPLGPLGLDYAYGFDRVVRDPLTGIVRPAPKWQLHFRLGQLF